MATATLPPPSDVRETWRPFSSWPRDGRPAGWFHRHADETAAAFFRDEGFLVIEDALTTAEVDELNRESLRIIRGEAGPVEGLIPAEPTDSDEEVLARWLCIHFPHKISTVMRRYLAHPAMKDVLTRIIGPDVKAMQSMLFIKSSGKPGQAWHQDELYIPTRDRSLTGGWIALDDATVENGCLWGIPGSHRVGVLWPQRDHGDRRFDCAHESVGFPYTDKDEVPLEVKAGSIIFFNGYFLHRSFPNRAERGCRRVLVNHYMSAQSLLPWTSDTGGKPVSTFDARDVVLVAGTDPYAYKGTVDVARPMIRPIGQGGCAGSWKEIVEREGGEILATRDSARSGTV
ncbi:MAG: phytanoyl-CoA dioxygenase family protein [Terrimicrobiaceae bacterium]|nr:phytanoyl-CoA dioxygenase family protein [Terrimicrobiaceae bacterium]